MPGPIFRADVRAETRVRTRRMERAECCVMPAGRPASSLKSDTAVAPRLEAVDTRLKVIEGVHEAANWRLSDFFVF